MLKKLAIYKVNIMKKLLNFVLLIILLYILSCTYIFFVQKDLIFFPSKKTFNLPSENNLEELSITSNDAINLNAWFLNNKSDKIIIFLHGNGWNIYYNKERLKIFNELNISAIMFDYRGYWKSDGKINKEEDIYNDAKTIYDYLINKWVKHNNIIIWGQSLGSAVGINLAQNKDIYAIIVESAFYSMDEMASKQYPFLPTTFISNFHFKNNEKISNINSPILIIHSKNDEMINISNAKRLFENANNPKLFLETKGSHNWWYNSSYDLYVSSLRKFLKTN